MKDGFRQSMAWLHTWTGLVVGWVLFFVFVTGTAGYFQQEITRWMKPELPMVQPQSSDAAAVERLVGLGFDRLEQVAPGAATWRITLPHESLQPRGWQEFAIRWEEMPPEGHKYGNSGSEPLDPASGGLRSPGPEPRDTAGGGGLYWMHYALHYMPYEWGIRIVGVCTMLMLIAIVSGVITHKKIFKDFFTFRPGKGQRSWLDAHNAVSVMALPFFLMITYSGLVFFMFDYMPAGRDAVMGRGALGEEAFYEEIYWADKKHQPLQRPSAELAPMVAKAVDAWGLANIATVSVNQRVGQPLAVTFERVKGDSVDPGNPQALRFDAGTGEALPLLEPLGGGAAATRNVLLSLHEGIFVGIWGRWLYFFAGLLGCAMIGTGLVLWAVKRRKHHLGSGREGAEEFGVRLVETLNVATIAGLPLAVAAYFLANRLLPLDIADRGAWELHALFAVWLGTLFYALARPLSRAWIELLWGACAAYALVPVVNALTTDRHLGHSLPAGDWVLAGFDLTMWGLAAIFAFMAVKVRRRLAPARDAAAAAHGQSPALEKGTTA